MTTKKRLSRSHFYDTQYASQYIVGSLKKKFSAIGEKIVRGPQKKTDIQKEFIF